MPVFTVNTKNFDAPMEIQLKDEAAADLIQSPYRRAGYVEKKPAQWDVPLKPGELNPTSGIHSCKKPWTNQTAAEEFVLLMNKWLDENPECKIYNHGPKVLVE